jgi:hypothetical protein
VDVRLRPAVVPDEVAESPTPSTGAAVVLPGAEEGAAPGATERAAP